MQALYELDKSLFEAIHAWRGPLLDPPFGAIADAGLGQIQAGGLLMVAAWRGWPDTKGRWVCAALLIVMLVVAWAHAEVWSHLAGLALTLAVVGWLSVREALTALSVAAVAGIVRLGIVEWADRLRPSNFAFADPLEHVYGYTSFPSGHASTSFGIAFAVLMLTWRSPRAWLGWVAMAYATAIGLSRIYVGVHYPTDVLAAAGLGAACAGACGLILARRARPIAD